MAVLSNQCEQDPLDLATNFCERLSTSERQLIEKWNATERHWPDDCCLHDLVESQAKRSPDAPAIICGDIVLSYRALHERAHRVAAALIAAGVVSQEPIGVIADCSADAIVGLLGILKAGGAYLPLDKTLPADRLRYFTEDAGVRFIVGDVGGLDWLAEENVKYFAPNFTDVDCPAAIAKGCEFDLASTRVTEKSSLREPGLAPYGLGGQASPAVQSEAPSITASITVISMRDLPTAEGVSLPKVTPDQLAYVLYTSGSTGKAKGVMLNHRGPVNTIRDINDRFGISSSDRVLALSSLGFDLSVYDVFGMLASGGTIVQPTLAEARDPEAWARLINGHSISVWNTVPALMDMLVTYTEPKTTYLSLRLVMLSGDWIPVSLPDRIGDAAPNAAVVSLGGSTEASIWSVIYPIDYVDPEWRSVPYGSAMLNQRLYVVDSDLRLCPIGEVGELCLAGIGVAEGYRNRAELTAERFVADPWDEGRLMYRTGDLCRYLPDGNLEFLGRRDHQVKIRGYRIGLGEIESEIERLPGVRDAAVIASEEGAGARLIAYVVPVDGRSLNLEQLNAQLGQCLPEYMLPSALVTMDRLPLSANGKVDRRQLPLPSLDRPASEILLPRTPTEAKVSSILCDLLNLPQIDIRDNFYALGGHSLLAVSLVCHIRSTCGVQLSVPEVLSKSLNTIELARLIDEGSPATVTSAGAPNWTKCSERLTRAPLSYSQQQLWVVNFLEQQRQRYNVPLIYDIQVLSPESTSRGHGHAAGLRVDALRFALNSLVKRHDILRTIYVANRSKLEQIVLPAAELPVHEFDLSHYPHAERASEVDRQVLEFVNQRFDLHEDWPIRAALYQLDGSNWRLVISVHHIAIDGLSVNLIQREIAERYQAYLDGSREENAPLTHQYANYASWQTDHMPPSSFDVERAYWREQLSGPVPVLDLPQDKVDQVDTEGETLYFQFDKSLFESVSQFARDNQVTPFITLLAAINAVFYRYTGQDDIVIASPVSTRADESTQDLVGYFINVLPLRSRFTGDESFVDLLSRVRETVLGAIAHRDYPLELLKKELLSSEGAGQDPFRVMFVLEEEPETLQLAGLTCKAKLIDTGTAKFDLLIAAFVSADKLRFELQYRRNCFHRDRIAALGRHLQAWLVAAVARPEQSIDRLEWLPAEDQAHLIGPVIEPRLSFLQTLNARIAEQPASIAAVFQSESISYAELDNRSSVLAAYLQQQGIASGDRVGINLPRSQEMLVAVLAVLKTGAAYVPLDPAWPGKRRNQVLEDCRPAVVLTHSRFDDLPRLESAAPIRLDCDTFQYVPTDSYKYRPVVIDPESTAYILYTSGSTGQPKGVAMRHAALDNLVAWQLQTSVAGSGTKTLQFASLGFDVSFQEIFATLCSGGQLLLVPEELQQDLNQLWKFIVSERVERLFVPFVALRGLSEIAGKQANAAALREVITAGEQLQATATVRSFFEQLPGCRLWNQYGPTETHVVTAKRLAEQPQQWSSSPTIGLPIDNCKVSLLDRHMQPLPRGIQGELFLGGECLANGYFGNPTLTNERFIGSESTACGERLYRTGDIGFVNWDGEIQFVGRNDHQVKVRGHRVELSEIELALAECPGIQQAVVNVHNCGAGTQLRAYLLTQQTQFDASAIASQLAETLPAYMIPQQFSIVDRFPTTASGKVDRQRLIDMNAEQIKPTTNTAKDSAEDPIASRLKPIWRSVLQIDDLDVDANFFDCGGDSLAAAILFSLMEAEFGRAISIDTLVKCPTIRQLAEVYRESSSVTTDDYSKLVPLQPQGTQLPIICLPGIDGHFLNFRHMAGLLGDDRPMFGLQPIGLNGTEEPLTEIVDIAADHVRTLRAAIPHGPYNLVGFSFGGIVAYEMAQMLRRQGEQVALALIDCSTGIPQRPSLTQSLAFHFRYARTLPKKRRWQYWLERINGYWLGLKFKLKLISWEQRLEGLIDVKGSYSRVAAVNMQALSRYRPEIATGPALLFRAQLRANWPGEDRTDPAVAWAPLFEEKSFSVVDIEGAHASVLNRPNVDKLVSHLREMIY